MYTAYCLCYLTTVNEKRYTISSMLHTSSNWLLPSSQDKKKKNCSDLVYTHSSMGKSILQVPDTGTRVLDNTIPFLCSSIVSFGITLACSKESKHHIFGQYWHTKNVPVLTNTGTFQYLGPEVYFFPSMFSEPLNFIHICANLLRKLRLKPQNLI